MQTLIAAQSHPLIGIIAATTMTAVLCYVAFECTRLLLRAKASRAWPSALGVVRKSEVVYARSGKKNVATHALEYEYTVDGVTYNGDRHSFLEVRGSFMDPNKDGLAKGQRVIVYYNPRSPDQAVLHKGTHWLHYLLPMLFVPLAIFLIAAYLKHMATYLGVL
jgi:hypothetical protein